MWEKWRWSSILCSAISFVSAATVPFMVAIFVPSLHTTPTIATRPATWSCWRPSADHPPIAAYCVGDFWIKAKMAVRVAEMTAE